MQMMNKILNLYKADVWKRTLIIWLFCQIVMWLIFGVSYLCHQDAWINVSDVVGNNDSINEWWSLFLFIVFNNLFICILIMIGNWFVRFNIITPGVLILLLQIIGIGWVAGSNAFEFPFTSVSEANIQYLKIGLWEVTAYIFSFSATISKSLNESNRFLPNKWDKTRSLKEMKPNKSEILIIAIAVILIIVAALIETFSLI